ncbi:DUF262 domain-containing protein [Olleya sp. ITB9]|uniref:DUF262 domain-containing protein n=1 Tax=Olleya sp. ITB9 TaxID=1715648 RepID=UPI0006D13C37|nr:DUF262 domain-containing protein [Olleya sp. ITB9]
MNLSAYPRTIKDILTLNRKYIIPRFQREYSWEKEELLTFWNDIIKQIGYSNKNLETSDYFIGALVLIGDDSNDIEFDVVDGQQRLTTITIMFSVLTQLLKTIDDNLAKSCYSYVEGKDGDFNPFFKLENENPKPFLQRRIQNFEKEQAYIPVTEEEKNLLFAYDYFYKKLTETSLSKTFETLKFRKEPFKYIDLLKIIRDQLLDCKTIFITVKDKKQAEKIFETLNAKGKDLETIDLIKNKIFEILSDEHPTDFAKENWKTIKTTLREREYGVNISTFFRHFWISKYEFLTERKIYESFQKNVTQTKKEYKSFINELIKVSEYYSKIISPNQLDWKEQEGKDIYYSLVALNTFRVTQHRPLFLTLFTLYDKKLININVLRETINKIEKFHFLFTAISSQRASGLESLYSKHSRSLRKLTDKGKIKDNLKDLFEKLKTKTPDIEIYKTNFFKLRFTNKITRDKKLIQYIFSTLENNTKETDELKVYNITLEHIESQKNNELWVSQMGNLLPLDGKINSKIGNIGFDKKIEKFKKSELKTVKEFCIKYDTEKSWDKTIAENRTNELSEITYELWKIK